MKNSFLFQYFCRITYTVKKAESASQIFTIKRLLYPSRNYLKPISIEFSSLIIGLQAFFMRNVHI